MKNLDPDTLIVMYTIAEVVWRTALSAIAIYFCLRELISFLWKTIDRIPGVSGRLYPVTHFLHRLEQRLREGGIRL